MAINKQQERTGSLFQKAFKRKQLSSEIDIKNAISYVHHNPIHHSYTITYDQYKWSSYDNYMRQKPPSEKHTKLLYGNLDDMIAHHQDYKIYKKEMNCKISLDMDGI